MLTFTELIPITAGALIHFATEQQVVHLLTDSRNVSQPAGSVFFAIKGQFNNGHLYISALYSRGVRQFVIEKLTEIPGIHTAEELAATFPEANFLLVESSLKALQQIAAHHRRQFVLPVIGITGSNGKTIVKEWLAQLLSPDEKVVKSPRSYNSQVGVPLSVWQTHENHTFGIFEAGISQPDEMKNLAGMIQPTFGIFTNLGTAHNEGFTDPEQKLNEKLQLFSNMQLLFCASKNELVNATIAAQKIPVFTWGQRETDTLQILHATQTDAKTFISYTYQETENIIELPFTDAASVENALHCLAFLSWRGIDPEIIQQRFNRLHAVAMRLEMKEAINNCYLIDDTYNNDLAGLTTALDLLVNQKRHAKKTVILSDLLEAGMSGEALYATVATNIQNRHINRFIGIGPEISRNRDTFKAGETQFFESTAEFLKAFSPADFHNETILLKGARIFEFEKIVALFGKKVHGTVLEVNMNALVHNLNYYRAKLQPGTKLMVMVKAFAYGSGSYEIANLLQFHRVDYLTVAYADEGVSLRENGISLPVMVMNPSSDSFPNLLRYHLEPEIYSLGLLKSFLQFIRNEAAPQFLVHLKLDTGMHRLGFSEEDLAELFELLASEPRLKIASIFSHLAGADEAIHNDFSRKQIAAFQQMSEQIETELGYPVLKHILNSAGIVRFPEFHFDMVRLGIGIYGVEASGLEPGALQNVGALKTTVSQVKTIRKGNTVGYSRRGIADTDKQIATLAIGYADGYDRRFGNGVGEVLINRNRAKIIGNICMDMCMVDVTGLNVQEGDEALIFGAELPVSELAGNIKTIPYELLTNVSPRVKRIFYSE